MTPLHGRHPAGDGAHAMRSRFTHHHGRRLREGFRGLRARAHLAAARLWRLRRAQGSSASRLPPPSGGRKGPDSAPDSRFQPGHVLHAGFTLPPLELPFAWITDANGTRYAMGVKVKMIPRLARPPPRTAAQRTVGWMWTHALVRSRGVSSDQWCFRRKSGPR